MSVPSCVAGEDCGISKERLTLHLITSSVSVKERAGRKFDLGPQQTLGKVLERSVRHDGISFGIRYEAVNKDHFARLRETFRDASCSRRLRVLVRVSSSSSPLGWGRGATLRGKKSREKPPAKERTCRDSGATISLFGAEARILGISIGKGRRLVLSG